MKKFSGIVLSAVGICAAGNVGAVPWTTIDPRAMGMGGAQVAIAQGPLASYYNPAGLGQLYNSSGIEIPVGVRAEFTGSVIQGAKDLYQLNQDCSATPPSANCTTAQIKSALSNLGQNGNGAMMDAGGSVSVKVKKMVLFVDNLTYIGATPQVDLINTGPLTVKNNSSSLILRGGSFTEFGLGCGHEIMETGLILGGNIKGVVGRIGYDKFSIVSKDPGKGALSDFENNSKTTVQASVDLGALWDMRETFPILPMRPRIGIVGRDINNPTFDQPAAAKAAGDRSRYSLHGQTRAGVALSPLKFWNLAADIDVTDNITPIDGYKSRYLSLGTEVDVFNRPWLGIPLRAGLQKNVSAGNSGLSYTAGFGLNFEHFTFDLAGMISSKRAQLQSQDKNSSIPNNFGASAQFAFLFGSADIGARNK